MSTEKVAPWVLLYHPDGKGAGVAWLVVEDVPGGTPQDEVLALVADWRKWPRFSARMALGARVSTRRVKAADELDTIPSWGWAELRPAEVRVSIPMPGELHARMRRQAARAGMSLQGYLLAQLDELVEL